MGNNKSKIAIAKNNMEELRECLNTMILENTSSSKELLKVSKKLDTLIVEFLVQRQLQENNK